METISSARDFSSTLGLTRKRHIRVIVENAEAVIRYHCVSDRVFRFGVCERGEAERVGRLRVEAKGIYEVPAAPIAAVPVQRPELPVAESVVKLYGAVYTWK